MCIIIISQPPHSSFFREGEQRCLMRYAPQQLIKGLYATFLPHWTAVYPREQFLLIRTEDYKAAPRQHVQATLDFLGVRPQEGIGMRTAEPRITLSQPGAPPRLAEPRNKKKYNPMLNQTRLLLQEFYRPYNERLSALMGGDKRWLWGY